MRILQLLTLFVQTSLILSSGWAPAKSAWAGSTCENVFSGGIGHFRADGSAVAAQLAPAHHAFLEHFGNYDLDSFVRNIFRQYPEIRYLLNEADVSAEAASAKPYAQSPSLKYGGAFRPEFDRTLLSLWTLQMILKGGAESYNSFIAAQKEANLPAFLQLKYESFTQLHQLFADVMKRSRLEQLDALIAFMVNHDIGKVKEFRRHVQALSQRSGNVDHDEAFLNALEHAPQLMQGLANVSPEMKKHIAQAAAANFGVVLQFAQGEAPAASMAKIEGIGRETYDFAFLHSILDVAGATGAKSFSGSGSMNEPVTQNFFKVHKALAPLAEGKANLLETYWQFFSDQAKHFNLTLNMDQAEDRAIARLLPLARTASAANAISLSETFAALSSSVKALLGSELSKNGVSDGWAIKLEYSPALFVSCLANFKTVPGIANPYQAGLNTAMTVMARLFGQARKLVISRQSNGELTVDLRELAAFAKDHASEIHLYDFALSPVNGNRVEVKFTKRPELSVEPLARFDFSQWAGQSSIFVAMGGGSDGNNAAMTGLMAERFYGSKISAVISVRAHPGDGKVQILGALSNPFADVYQIGPETTGQIGSTGRFVEKAYAKDFPSYIILDRNDGTLATKLSDLRQLLDKSARFVGFDTGGDSATRVSTSNGEGFQATPDRDHLTLQALATASRGESFVTLTVGPGMDSPEYASEVYASAQAQIFFPSDDQAKFLLSAYAERQLDGSRPDYFGVTMFGWQAALRGMEGWSTIPIPSDRVLDPKNPWFPFARVEKATRGIVVMDGYRHLKAIGAQPIPYGQYEYDKISDWSWKSDISQAMKSWGFIQKLGGKEREWQSHKGKEVVGIYYDIRQGRTLVFRGEILGTRAFFQDGRGGTFGVIRTSQGETIETFLDAAWDLFVRP